MQFADVIVPLPLAESYTYIVPADLTDKIGVGYRVIVPFGKKKYYTAIVTELHERAPLNFQAKEIYSLLDTHPIVNENQLKLWKWISFYYLCSIGEVYNAALPGRLKLESDTYITFVSDSVEAENLTDVEAHILHYLSEKKSCKISELDKELKIKDSLPYIYSLVYKGAVNVSEDVVEKYTPKSVKFISLNKSITEAESVIGGAKKQQELYRLLSAFFLENSVEDIAKTKLLKRFGFSSSVLKGLIDKGVLIEFEKDISRIESAPDAIRQPYPLNQFQDVALDEIGRTFEEKNVCLLHGITSSGKTEIYIYLIAEHLEKGNQVLYLVPEIALTTQLTSRLQEVFGDKLGIYHSKVNDNRRAEIWLKMLSDDAYDIIVGPRSAVFLPFNKLGLVIVDEEHESSYRQQEPAPRYHARDVAIVMAQSFDAKVLLGSATPSVESYYNAKRGKYGLVSLSKRYEEIELPEIFIENTKELRRTKKMKTLLTPSLIDEINIALENGEQAILFRNRRGFVPMLECKNCGWTPKCKHCDVSLTYHKRLNEFKCHYCGRSYRVSKTCEVCNEESLDQIGMGTEMLEEEVRRIFPEVSVARLDSDTTTSGNSYEHIIARFQEGSIDVLIGTQMLSKGLDFENVSVVGIIAADGLLSHTDFRSHERGFQLMMQSAGRAGRKHKRGKVIVQAGDPDLPVYKFVREGDYEGFFNLQLSERRIFNYPPYTRLITIVFKHRNEQLAHNAAQLFADLLRQSLSNMVLGPNKPIVGYIQRYHIREILLKLDVKLSAAKVRELIKLVEVNVRDNPKYRYIQLYYDVDWV